MRNNVMFSHENGNIEWDEPSVLQDFGATRLHLYKQLKHEYLRKCDHQKQNRKAKILLNATPRGESMITLESEAKDAWVALHVSPILNL